MAMMRTAAVWLLTGVLPSEVSTGYSPRRGDPRGHASERVLFFWFETARNTGQAEECQHRVQTVEGRFGVSTHRRNTDASGRFRRAEAVSKTTVLDAHERGDHRLRLSSSRSRFAPRSDTDEDVRA